MQADWKKLVAYSSVSHLGFCTLGIFALNQSGIAGSVIQQINHGISTGMLFLVVGVIYERRHTREIKEFGEVGACDAKLRGRVRDRDAVECWFAAVEWLCGRIHDPAGAFDANKVWAAFAVLGVIFWRGLFAVALPTDDAGRGYEREEQGTG